MLISESGLPRQAPNMALDGLGGIDFSPLPAQDIGHVHAP
jgi:hypothetical protein